MFVSRSYQAVTPVKQSLHSRNARNMRVEQLPKVAPRPSSFSWTSTRRSGSRSGRGRISSAWITLNSATFAQMPRDTVSAAVMVKPGRRLRERWPKTTSWMIELNAQSCLPPGAGAGCPVQEMQE